MINSIGEINRRPIGTKSLEAEHVSKGNVYAVQFLVLVIGTFVGFWGAALLLF